MYKLTCGWYSSSKIKSSHNSFCVWYCPLQMLTLIFLKKEKFVFMCSLCSVQEYKICSDHAKTHKFIAQFLK